MELQFQRNFDLDPMGSLDGRLGTLILMSLLDRTSVSALLHMASSVKVAKR
jgi:hypothetical protein